MKTTRMIIEELAERYMEDEDNFRGFISKVWIERVTEALKLRELDDLALANMWDMVWLTLENRYHYYDDRDTSIAFKYLDVQSAFTEVVNSEARRRREVNSDGK